MTNKQNVTNTSRPAISDSMQNLFSKLLLQK